MENNQDNVRKTEHFKILTIALFIVYLFAAVSFGISLITKDELILETKEILYIIVMAISLVFAIIFLVLYRKNKQKN